MSSESKEIERPIESSIRQKLQSIFSPVYLDVINESHKHSVPRGSETHFNVVVISSLFDGKPLLARHRMINSALQEEIDGPVHALSITAKTPEQWDKSTIIHASPPCLGGSKKN